MHELFLLLAAVSVCHAEDYYVKPSNSTENCPEPCHTFEEYATNFIILAGETHYNFLFLPGRHVFTKFTIYGAEDIQMKPYNQENIGNVTITLLNKSADLIPFLLDALRISLEKISFDSVDIDVGYTNTEGGTVMHQTTITNCTILRGSVKLSLISLQLGLVQIYNTELNGGSVSDYGINLFFSGSQSLAFDIENTTIHDYTDTGLYFVGIDPTDGIITATVTNSQILRIPQGAFIVGLHNILLQNSSFSFAEKYGMLIIFANVTLIDSEISYNEIGIIAANGSLFLMNSNISSNTIGMVVLQMATPNPMQSMVEKSSILMLDCNINFNFITSVALLYFHDEAVFTNCKFSDNTAPGIIAYESEFTLEGEVVFTNNLAERGGGLALYQSIVTFAPGSVIRFANNKASEYGGAIYISSPALLNPRLLATIQAGNNIASDTLYLENILSRPCFYNSHPDVNVTFSRNSAVLGGKDVYGAGIRSYLNDTQAGNCRFLPDFFFDPPVSTSLQETSLQVASDPQRVCFCAEDVPQCFNKTFIIINETRFPGESFQVPIVLVGFNFGQVSGPVFIDITDYFFREDTVQLSSFEHVQNYVYGQCNEVTLTVSINQGVSEKISGAYAVLAAQDSERFQLQDDLVNINSPACDKVSPSPCTAILNTPVYINITLQQCPLGFELNRICNCDQTISKLQSSGLTIGCEVTNRTGFINTQGSLWIGIDEVENTTSKYYWHKHCPNNFCTQSKKSINLLKPDTQCGLNRAGVLCGKCRPGFALQLGGNKCFKCNNGYLALLIVFALQGILLVAFIKILDLTVTTGTINGLIFYANIVWRNNAILFPLEDRNSIGYYIVTVPLAWVNLDFGIETCLSESLDQLTKTGIQFVFPVYIWWLAGVIILASHYSVKVTRFFGTNSVAVLATLFLLSYGKLFKNITDVFSYADITDSNGITRKVWGLDGNIHYGQTPGHIILMLIALGFLVLFWLPATLALVLVPFLHSITHLKPLRWINRLEPFFDTYYGPFKIKRRYRIWTGMLLLSRVLILIVYAASSTQSPNANILLMTIVAILLLMYSAMVGLLYKQWYLSLLENVYILNLVILGAGFLFYQISNENIQQTYQLSPVATLSVVVAMIQFGGIVLFHIVRKFFWKRIQTHLKKRHELQEAAASVNDVNDIVSKDRGEITQTTIELVKSDENGEKELVQTSTGFREPLLGSDSESD